MPHDSVDRSYHFWILNFRVQLGTIDFCITPVHFNIYINREHKQRWKMKHYYNDGLTLNSPWCISVCILLIVTCMYVQNNNYLSNMHVLSLVSMQTLAIAARDIMRSLTFAACINSCICVLHSVWYGIKWTVWLHTSTRHVHTNPNLRPIEFKYWMTGTSPLQGTKYNLSSHWHLQTSHYLPPHYLPPLTREILTCLVQYCPENHGNQPNNLKAKHPIILIRYSDRRMSWHSHTIQIDVLVT